MGYSVVSGEQEIIVFGVFFVTLMDIDCINFSVGFQNIQGLHNAVGCKVNDLKESLSNDIEILAETWGCNCNVTYEGYTYVAVKPQKHEGITRGRKSGGLIVLLKNYLSKKFRILKSSNNFIWIEIDKSVISNLRQNFIIVATYISDITSTYFNDSIFEEFYSDILKYSNEGTPILFTGDFNGRTGETEDCFIDPKTWGDSIPTPNTFVNLPKRKNCDSVVNSHGEKIIHICQTFDFRILNGRTKGDKIGNYTHLNINHGESCIDYSICNQYLYELVENFIVLPLSELSDHSKISTILKGKVNTLNFDNDNYKWNTVGSKFKWCKDNIKKFTDKLKNQTKEIDEISQRIEAGLINSTGERIQNLFKTAAKCSLQVTKSFLNKNWKKKKKSKKWFDEDCSKLKHDVRRIGREKHSSSHNNLLREKYHEKLKEFKKTCKSKRNLFWNNKLSEVEQSLNDPKMFWQKWKNAKEEENFSSDTKIQGKKWFDHFCELHTETKKKASDECFSFAPDKDQIELEKSFSRTKFDKILRELKRNKSEGLDGISNEMVINSPPVVLDLLYNFINLCLNKSLIPQEWCKDTIIPIHKDGDMNDPNNYRGICVSSALLKIVCTLLKDKIETFCTRKEIIHKDQIGFKKGHRTSDHLFTLKTIVKKYVTIGKNKIFACFIDLKKAFDSVWHEGLFYKLNKIGVLGKPFQLIKDIYKKTICAVKIKNRITIFFNYTKGVRQGCPLSALLFNIYLNDLFDLLNENNDSNLFLSPGTKLNVLMYADDLVILSDSKEGLQNQLDKLESFCTKWKLTINTRKTKVVVFNRGNRPIHVTIKINDKPLECVKSVKYLGFCISAKNCSFSPTINDLSIKASRAIFALNNKIKLSKLPTRLALKLFQSLLLPILLYGCEVWGPYIDNDCESWEKSKIEQIHVQYLKRILGCNINTSNIMARGEVGVRPLILEIINRTINYTKSIKERNTSTVFSAFNYELCNTYTPNFTMFVSKVLPNQYDIESLSRIKIRKKINEFYDRYWTLKLSESPKAITYTSIKNTVFLEKYLCTIENLKHKIALSRFRLSNHDLLIEKGRHMRPRLERSDRKCFLCKDKIENEIHFLTECPLYNNERKILFNSCRRTCPNFDYLVTNEQIFCFVMTSEEPIVIRNLAKFIFQAFKIRHDVL